MQQMLGSGLELLGCDKMLSGAQAIKATGLRKTKGEFKAIFAAADTNGDGQLDWDEFKRVMQAMPELQALSMDAGNALDGVKGGVSSADDVRRRRPPAP